MVEVVETTQSQMVFIPLPIVDTSVSAQFVPCAAYDIGSGATKYMGAMVDTQSLTIESVFSQGSLPVAYREDLYHSQDNSFSDLIQEMGLAALQSAKLKIQQDYENSKFHDYGDIQHFAVATAAFREADNGALVAQMFHDKLDIPVNIISQEEEAKLAYYGATSEHHDTSSDLPIVWDIGGGSMQLTYKDSHDLFHIMGGEVASQTFQSLVSEKVMGIAPTETPNPMNATQVEAAIAAAKEHLTFDATSTQIIKDQITKGTDVVAVGSVHNFVVQPLCKLAGINHDSSFYTKEDLSHAIALLTNKTDEEISKLAQLSDPKFAQNQLTNLILVYSMMDIMGIDKVHTKKVSNVQGIMIQNMNNRPRVVESPIFVANLYQELSFAF